MFAQRGKMHPKLDAPSTRHVFRYSKTCRDTCPTVMGSQVTQEPTVNALQLCAWVNRTEFLFVLSETTYASKA